MVGMYEDNVTVIISYGTMTWDIQASSGLKKETFRADGIVSPPYGIRHANFPLDIVFGSPDVIKVFDAAEQTVMAALIPGGFAVCLNDFKPEDPMP